MPLLLFRQNTFTNAFYDFNLPELTNLARISDQHTKKSSVNKISALLCQNTFCQCLWCNIVYRERPFCTEPDLNGSACSGWTGTCLGRILDLLNGWQLGSFVTGSCHSVLVLLPFCSPMPAMPDAWGLCSGTAVICSEEGHKRTILPVCTPRLSYTSAVDLWLRRGLWLHYCLSCLPWRGPYRPFTMNRSHSLSALSQETDYRPWESITLFCWVCVYVCVFWACGDHRPDSQVWFIFSTEVH